LKNNFFIVFALFTTLSFAQTARKYSNEFMNIGVDAAALGMSNAVTACSNDVNSGYWNPAGLIGLEDKQVSLMHASYFANIAQYLAWHDVQPVSGRSAEDVDAQIREELESWSD
jgi:hypothetical protein